MEMLKGKLRLLITHRTEYLPFADHVIYIENVSLTVLCQNYSTYMSVCYCVVLYILVYMAYAGQLQENCLSRNTS